jgi:hypothetical protein
LKENKASMFWLKRKNFFLPTSRWLLILHTLQPWKQRQYIPPKHHGTNGLHDVKTRKIGTSHIHLCKNLNSNRIESQRPCVPASPRHLRNWVCCHLSSLVIQSGRERGSDLSWSWAWHNNYVISFVLPPQFCTRNKQMTNLWTRLIVAPCPLVDVLHAPGCVLFSSFSSSHDIEQLSRV